jgi:hypothetical protein
MDRQQVTNRPVLVECGADNGCATKNVRCAESARERVNVCYAVITGRMTLLGPIAGASSFIAASSE